MLKLKDASYPEPEGKPVLVNEYAKEVTYDLGKDGSKWAHGFIPLNPAAVALKHHKTPGGDGGGSTAKGIASRDSGATGKMGNNVVQSPGRGGTGTRHAVRDRGELGSKYDVIDQHAGNEVVATHDGRNRALSHARALNTPVSERTEAQNGIVARHAKPTAAKSAEPREFKTMKQRRVEASPRALVNSGDVRLHATKDDGGSKIGTVSKYPSGGFRAQHKDDATAHAGSPFATRQEAVGALVLQHESRTPKTQAERVSELRGKLADNASDRATLEGHAAALAVPIKDRTADQQKAAADALAYAKELRAKRLAAKKPSAPKVKRNTNNGLSTSASIRAARERETTARNSSEHRLGR